MSSYILLKKTYHEDDLLNNKPTPVGARERTARKWGRPGVFKEGRVPAHSGHRGQRVSPGILCSKSPWPQVVLPPSNPTAILFHCRGLAVRKLLKCFRLMWGFPLELSCSFLRTKQNSADRAMDLSPNFLLNHLPGSICFALVGTAPRPGPVPSSWQNGHKSAMAPLWTCDPYGLVTRVGHTLWLPATLPPPALGHRWEEKWPVQSTWQQPDPH